MGRPMLPSPMNPIRRHLILLSPGAQTSSQSRGRTPASGVAMHAAIAASDTSARLAGRQRGRRSLSTSSARTPFDEIMPPRAHRGPSGTRAAMPLRWSSPRPRRSWAKVSGQREGRLGRQLRPLCGAEAARLLGQQRQHARQRVGAEAAVDGRPVRAQDGLGRYQLVAGQQLDDGGMRDRPPRRSRPARPRSRRDRPRPRRGWRSRHRRSRSPRSRAPVRPRYIPTSPGQRGRNQVPPTSGKKPMPVSGMANRVRSVAIRKSAMHRDADAAAHGDAVDAGDVGLGVGVDAPVQPVLVAEERHRRGHAAGPQADRSTATMSPPAQNARPGAALTRTAPISSSSRHRASCRLSSPDHGVGERVQRLLAVEDRHAQPALALEADVRGHSARSRRAMITRMISLVPSRIWCTRQSRR